MEKQLPNKRQRTTYTASSSSASTELLKAGREAQQLEHDTVLAEQFRRLRSGEAQKEQVAWSRNNLIAIASNSAKHVNGAYVALQYASNRAPRPCRLFPPSPPAQSSAAQTAASASTLSYDDPTSIAFSPCGYYLCAFFPLPETLSRSRQVSPDQSNLVRDLFPTGSATDTLPIGILSASDRPIDGSAKQPAARSTQTCTGQLCIWSSVESGSLNDWNLVLSVPVSEDNGRKTNTGQQKDNVMKVDENGQVVTDEAGKVPGEKKQEPTILYGGVLRTLWLNQGRRLVAQSTSTACPTFKRLGVRGPSFTSSSPTAGPDSSIALLVFGKQGQVALIHSRQSDRHPSMRKSPSTPACFTILQSSIHVPGVQPAPVTLDSDTSQDSTQPHGAIYSDVLPASQAGDISHMAVGLCSNSAALLVASKRSPYTNATLDLTEVSVDLAGETISLITRPVRTLCLVAASDDVDASREGSSLEGPSHQLKAQDFSGITWAEIEESPMDDADPSRVGGLRLLAAFTNHRGAGDSSEQDGQTQFGDMKSWVKVWDLCRTEHELSDAFASLECRKPGNVPRWHEYYARPSSTLYVADKAITSIAGTLINLPSHNTGLITMLVQSSTSLREEHCFLDVGSMTMTPCQVAVPLQAMDRSSSLILSPNGCLVAGLSTSKAKAAGKQLLLWDLLQLNDTKNEGSVSSRCSELLALACLRRSDACDILRLFKHVPLQDYSAIIEKTGNLLRIATSGKYTQGKLEGGADLPKDSSRTSKTAYGHTLQLLQLRALLGLSSEDPRSSVAQYKRLNLELGLCLQVLQLARVREDVVPKSEDSTIAVSSAGRVYYQLDSVWSVLAQLRWLLTLLNRIVREAQLPPRANPLSDTVGQNMASLFDSSPRWLISKILACFCDFKEWLLSTTQKQNLPPPRLHGESRQASVTQAAWNDFSTSTTVTAVSEEMDLARDTLRHILVSSSIGLEGFARVLADPKSKEDNADEWWSELLSSDKAAGGQGSLQKAFADPDTSALLDKVALFISPADMLDERNVVFDTDANQAADQLATEKEDSAIDIVRKLSLKSAYDQSTLNALALSNSAAFETGAVMMRKKRCLWCRAESQDAVCVTTTPLPANPSVLLSPSQTVSIKLQSPTSPTSNLSAFEEAFRIACICGGPWWVSQ